MCNGINSSFKWTVLYELYLILLRLICVVLLLRLSVLTLQVLNILDLEK